MHTADQKLKIKEKKNYLNNNLALVILASWSSPQTSLLRLGQKEIG